LECFEKAAVLPARANIDRLVALGDEWRQGKPQNDNITLMVIRVKRLPAMATDPDDASRLPMPPCYGN
jgi:hypothetical protein